MRARRSLISSEDQGATFVELFFDLVFVFAVTEVTGTLAEHLTWQGLGRAVVVFWLIWWAWTQFTWTLNPADTDHPWIRIATLAATGITFVMAASVHDAFTPDGGPWFALPYVVVRLTGLSIHAALGTVDRDLLRVVKIFGGFSLFGLSAVIIGAYASPSMRGWWWLGAIVLDLAAAGVGGGERNSAGWHVRPAHFIERHGLFVIIALGESLIAAGSTAVGGERSMDLAIVALLAVGITCLLWWTYFGWLHPALERGLLATDDTTRAAAARDAFSVLHFPLIGGVIGLAVAFEEAIAHPTDPLHGEVTAALVIGLVLFLGASAAAHARVGGGMLWPRAAVTTVMAVLLLAFDEQTPVVAFTITLVAITTIVAAERRRTASAT